MNKTQHIVSPILLIEDDYVDVLTVKRALKDIGINTPIVHKENGEKALNYLNNQDNLLPAVILLDLNMPRLNGLDFLEVLEKQARTKMIPTLVLTTSTEHHEKINSFDQNIIAYMVKPMDYKQFTKMLGIIKPYLDN